MKNIGTFSRNSADVYYSFTTYQVAVKRKKNVKFDAFLPALIKY